jgi:hypothetical protein
MGSRRLMNCEPEISLAQQDLPAKRPAVAVLREDYEEFLRARLGAAGGSRARLRTVGITEGICWLVRLSGLAVDASVGGRIYGSWWDSATATLRQVESSSIEWGFAMPVTRLAKGAATDGTASPAVPPLTIAERTARGKASGERG